MAWIDDLRAAKADIDRQIAETLNYYTPPHLRPLVGMVAEANPVVSMERAGTASRGLLSNNATPMQRVGYAGDMLSNMAGVAAPAMVAGRAGVPAANAIQEGLLGMSQTARLPEFMADESGALRLFHGSPHDFDRFSMDKIGTGEGAQAYGHGLYFAENEGIAKSYRDALSGNRFGDKRVFKLDGMELPNPTRAQHLVGRRGGDTDANVDHVLGFLGKQLKEAQEKLNSLPSLSSGDELSDLDINVMRAQSDVDKLRADIAEVEGLRGRRMEVQQPGNMYEVEVNANPEDFLDYDAPLSAQPEVARRMGYASPDEIAKMKAEVNQGLAKIAPDGNISALFDNPTPEFERLRKIDSEARSLTDWSNMTGSDVAFRQFQDPVHHATNVKKAADAGIPGIRYLDAGSRGAGDGSRNYVVFDENLINIVRKYGIAGAAAMLGMSEADVAQAMEPPAYDLDSIDAWMQGR